MNGPTQLALDGHRPLKTVFHKGRAVPKTNAVGFMLTEFQSRAYISAIYERAGRGLVYGPPMPLPGFTVRRAKKAAEQ